MLKVKLTEYNLSKYIVVLLLFIFNKNFVIFTNDRSGSGVLSIETVCIVM